MTAKIADADWLTQDESCEVMAALEAARPACARFVGGCVRNTLMGRPVDDVDIATQLTPDRVIAALEAAGIRALPTGIEHGTVTAVVNHVPFEITSLRRDVETDGRRAVVAFTEDWAEDAQRRDFRLNALYAEPDGTLHDPTGGGLSDAAAGRVIFIGDADERLREDYLRILRFFRFNAWYGAEIDAAGLAACARQRLGLEQIAAERVWKELKKLLGAPDPVGVVHAMHDTGVLFATLPEADTLRGLAPVVAVEKREGLSPDPMRRLMTLIMSGARDSRQTGDRLHLSNAETERLANWELVCAEKPGLTSRVEMRAAFYRFGVEAVMDWVMGDTGVGEGNENWLSGLLAAAETWQRPVFPLKGGDLVEQGFEPGPAIGAMLRELEDWWVAGDFTMDRTALLDELERRLKQD